MKNEDKLEKLEILNNHLHSVIEEYKNGLCSCHPFDIAKELLTIRELDSKTYKSTM